MRGWTLLSLTILAMLVIAASSSDLLAQTRPELDDSLDTQTDVVDPVLGGSGAAGLDADDDVRIVNDPMGDAGTEPSGAQGIGGSGASGQLITPSGTRPSADGTADGEPSGPPRRAGDPAPEVDARGVTQAAPGFGGEPNQVDLATQQELELLREEIGQAREALEAASTRIEELEGRVEEEEAQSAQIEDRSLAANLEVRAADRELRLERLARAMEMIDFLQDQVAAGTEEVGFAVSGALSALDLTSQQAGTWGSAAEADNVQRAMSLIRAVPAMVSTRNFQDATGALVAAEEYTRQARALAQAAEPSTAGR